MSSRFWKKTSIVFITLFIVASATFFLMHTIPGNPFLDERALPEEVLAVLNKYYGLDKPLWYQYMTYIKKLFFFDLGPSLQFEGRNVSSIITQGFPISCLLGLEALFLAITIGSVCGITAALKHTKKEDRLILLYGVLALSVPSFVMASFLQYFLGIKCDLFPVARWGSFAQSVLPALSLSALPSAFITRLLRSSMIETLHQDYILTAKTKGLSPFRILFVHVLPNSLLPVMAYLGPLSASILTGSFAVEKVFAIPGLGGWFVSSIATRDYTLIMGLTLFYSTIVVSFAYFIDLIYHRINPRLRASQEET